MFPAELLTIQMYIPVSCIVTLVKFNVPSLSTEMRTLYAPCVMMDPLGVIQLTEVKEFALHFSSAAMPSVTFRSTGGSTITGA